MFDRFLASGIDAGALNTVFNISVVPLKTLILGQTFFDAQFSLSYNFHDFGVTQKKTA